MTCPPAEVKVSIISTCDWQVPHYHYILYISSNDELAYIQHGEPSDVLCASVYPALISAFTVIDCVHLHSKKFEKHDFSMRKLYRALTIEADSFDEGLGDKILSKIFS